MASAGGFDPWKHGMSRLPGVAIASRPGIGKVAVGLLFCALLAFSGCLDQTFDNPNDPDRELDFRRESYLEIYGPIAVRSSLVWVLDEFRESLRLFDIATSTERHQVSLGGVDVGGIAEEEDRLWLSDRLTRQLIRVEPLSGSQDQLLLLPLVQPEALAYDATRRTLFVFDRGRQEIVEVSPQERRIVKEIPVVDFDPVDMTVIKEFLLALDETRQEIWYFDTASGALTRQQAVEVTGVGIDGENSELFILGRDGWLYRSPLDF